MNDKLILKNRLKEARTQANLSQAQLSELVGVSRNTISSIETGQFNPTAKLALILCVALDKKFEDLLSVNLQASVGCLPVRECRL
jgi:putative transcriptional regulator